MSNVTLKEKVSTHKNICNQINELYSNKNFAYGDSFAKTLGKRGLAALTIVLEGKFNRLDHITASTGGEWSPEAVPPECDSLEDTLLDIANYAIIALVELKLGASNPPQTEEVKTPNGGSKKKDRKKKDKAEAPVQEKEEAPSDPQGLAGFTKHELITLSEKLGIEIPKNRKKLSKEKLISDLYDKSSKKKLGQAIKETLTPSSETLPEEPTPDTEDKNEEA